MNFANSEEFVYVPTIKNCLHSDCDISVFRIETENFSSYH